MEKVQDDFEALQLCSTTDSCVGFMQPENDADVFVREQILILVSIFSSQRHLSANHRPAQAENQTLNAVAYEAMPPPAKFIRRKPGANYPRR